MYQKKFAVALKSARGQVLREVDGDKVYIPFGSEYSVFLKNMHDRRAVAQITIDGQDVGDGATFIIPPHSHLNVERFIKDGNLAAGNRFKFIERTDKVAGHRGVDVEDGLVRVTFQLEHKPRPVYKPTINVSADPWRDPGTWEYTSSGDGLKSFNSSGGPTMDSMSIGSSAEYSANLGSARSRSVKTSYSPTPANEVGVTAPGSVSDQSFVEGEHFPLEAEKIVFVLQILGETEDNRPVHKPVTVKTRPQCSQCGTFNHFGAKFCRECGASLQIV